MNFADAIRAQIVAHKPNRRTRRILDILDARPSKRRTRIIERMERHARAALDLDPTVELDWSQIDWAKVFDTIIKLLLALLPLLI